MIDRCVVERWRGGGCSVPLQWRFGPPPAYDIYDNQSLDTDRFIDYYYSTTYKYRYKESVPPCSFKYPFQRLRLQLPSHFTTCHYHLILPLNLPAEISSLALGLVCTRPAPKNARTQSRRPLILVTGMVCLSCQFYPTSPSDSYLILFQWTLRKHIITKKVRASFHKLAGTLLFTSWPSIDVGRAIRNSGVPRPSVFLTSKYMPSHTVYSPTEVLDVVRKSLKKVDRCGDDKPYIDLMLIHAPWGGEEGRKNNWEALTIAQKEGWVKDIGVSNLCVLLGVAMQWCFSL